MRSPGLLELSKDGPTALQKWAKLSYSEPLGSRRATRVSGRMTHVGPVARQNLSPECSVGCGGVPRKEDLYIYHLTRVLVQVT